MNDAIIAVEQVILALDAALEYDYLPPGSRTEGIQTGLEYRTLKKSAGKLAADLTRRDYIAAVVIDQNQVRGVHGQAAADNPWPEEAPLNKTPALELVIGKATGMKLGQTTGKVIVMFGEGACAAAVTPRNQMLPAGAGKLKDIVLEQSMAAIRHARYNGFADPTYLRSGHPYVLMIGQGFVSSFYNLPQYVFDSMQSLFDINEVTAPQPRLSRQ